MHLFIKVINQIISLFFFINFIKSQNYLIILINISIFYILLKLFNKIKLININYIKMRPYFIKLL